MGNSGSDQNTVTNEEEVIEAKDEEPVFAPLITPTPAPSPLLPPSRRAGVERGFPYAVASTKEIEIINDTMREGFFNYGVPSALTAVAATFFLRMRHKQAKSTSVENFLLAALHYYGATTLGMTIGLTIFGPTFNKRILEKIPHSDLARQIRAEESKRQSE